MAGEKSDAPEEHGHGHTHEHAHGVSRDADRRWLVVALVLFVGFMVVEVVIGLIAGSLALLSDAGHMLTDAAAIALALIAMRLSRKPASGRYTYGLKRSEILSAQVNGITLLLLAAYFVYEGIHRLIDPSPVDGLLVMFTALAGVVVNLAATWSVSRANRSSLNVEGAFQHILNDLYAFIATAVAGAVIVFTEFYRADAIAALIVAALMIKAGWALVRDSGRVFLEAAPAGFDPEAIGRDIVALPEVVEVHDLHLWEITSGEPSLSAHVLVGNSKDCHDTQVMVENVLREDYGIEHTTLQVDHTEEREAQGARQRSEHCREPHGPVHTVTEQSKS